MSVCAQRPAASQRRGRCLPAFTAHPAKMLPTVAVTASTAYTRPGDLVLDPMCGIGTTLVEATYLGRPVVGVELESRWATLARANLDHAQEARRPWQRRGHYRRRPPRPHPGDRPALGWAGGVAAHFTPVRR
ncbi:TRM11 family SAM-dependent methyltransferase [Actinomadura terrae]|uniref:TRM11 family SAM-dependent methyltransferase n=1 Tax=Actinomadura terrae TaxID=604353 RepID=UPI0035591837